MFGLDASRIPARLRAFKSIVNRSNFSEYTDNSNPKHLLSKQEKETLLCNKTKTPTATYEPHVRQRADTRNFALVQRFKHIYHHRHLYRSCATIHLAIHPSNNPSTCCRYHRHCHQHIIIRSTQINNASTNEVCAFASVSRKKHQVNAKSTERRKRKRKNQQTRVYISVVHLSRRDPEFLSHSFSLVFLRPFSISLSLFSYSSAPHRNDLLDFPSLHAECARHTSCLQKHLARKDAFLHVSFPSLSPTTSR